MSQTLAAVDVAIIGGGFAGLVCARTLALQGLEVAVFERKFAPGDRVHTTGILVKEAAEALDIPQRFTRRVHRVRLHGPSLAYTDLHSPGYYFLATDTAGLLAWLAREAERAGARVHCGQTFRGARRVVGGLALDGLGVVARQVVGADGAHSKVARHFGLGVNRRYLVGVEAEYAGDDHVDPDHLHCFLDADLAPGYIGWIVPGVGITQVGLACTWPRRPDLDALLERTRAIAPLADLKPVGWRAGTIPVGGLVAPFATDGVVLVGDAAGLVSPLTAGGIANAFHFGRRAAQAISDRLLDGGPEPGRVLAAEYPRYRFKSALRHLLELGPSNRLMDRALEVALVREVARRIFFHRRRCASAHGASRYFRPAPAVDA